MIAQHGDRSGVRVPDAIRALKTVHARIDCAWPRCCGIYASKLDHGIVGCEGAKILHFADL